MLLVILAKCFKLGCGEGEVGLEAFDLRASYLPYASGFRPAVVIWQTPNDRSSRIVEMIVQLLVIRLLVEGLKLRGVGRLALWSVDRHGDAEEGIEDGEKCVVG